jgi:hypothetical protein
MGVFHFAMRTSALFCRSVFWAVLGISGALPAATQIDIIGPPGGDLALWAGNTTLGNDNSRQALRLPILQLRKGDIYGTLQQSLGVVRSLSLKPAVDRSGAGGRGLAQADGFDGDVAIYITGDRGVTELVLLHPVQPVPVF